MTTFDPIIVLLVGSLPLLMFSLIGLIRSITAKNNEIKRLSSKPAGAFNRQAPSEYLSGGADKQAAGSDNWAAELSAKDAEIKRLNTQSSGMLARQDQFEKKIAQYKKMELDIGRLERERDEYKQKTENFRIELTGAKAGFTDGEARLAEKDAEIKRLAEQLAAKETGTKRLTDQFTAKDAEIKRLTDQLTAKDTEIKLLTNQLPEKDADIDQLAEQLAAKETGTKRLADQLTANDAEIKRLAGQLSEKDVEIDQLAGQLAANYIEIKELNAKLVNMRAPRKLPEKLAAKTGGLKAGSPSGPEQLAAENVEIKLLAEQLAAKDAEIEDYQHKIENLHWEIDKLWASAAKGAKQLAAKDAEIKRLTKSLI